MIFYLQPWNLSESKLLNISGTSNKIQYRVPHWYILLITGMLLPGIRISTIIFSDPDPFIKMDGRRKPTITRISLTSRDIVRVRIPLQEILAKMYGNFIT